MAAKKPPAQETGLKKKYGPLPLWGWLVAGVVVYYVYTRSSSSTSTTPATQAGGGYTGGSGGGAYGGGYGGGGSTGGGGGGLASALNGLTSFLQGQAATQAAATPANPVPPITLNIEPNSGSTQTAASTPNSTGNPVTAGFTGGAFKLAKGTLNLTATPGYGAIRSGSNAYYPIANAQEAAQAQRLGGTVVKGSTVPGGAGGTTEYLKR